MFLRLALGLLLTACLCSGCQPAATDQTGSATAETPAAPPQPRESLPPPSEPFAGDGPGAPTPDAVGLVRPDTSITMIHAPWETIQEYIARNFAGKIVVVDLWATYCAPCRESFPGLVALSQLDPENIVCVSVSLDDHTDEDKRDGAIGFLKEQKATFTNFLCTSDTETLYNEILQIGGIPAVYVYGRDGQLAKLFNGPSPEGEDHTYEKHITPYVTELAAAK